jgi:hypothetical protein
VAAGLPETIRTYDIRHSHASLLIDLGASPLAVAHQMGHSDPAVTLRNYGHLFEGAQAKLAEQLDALRASTASDHSEATVIDLAAHRAGPQYGACQPFRDGFFIDSVNRWPPFQVG